MSEPGGTERPWEADFEAELDSQRRAELLLMLRGLAILLIVAALVALRALLL